MSDGFASRCPCGTGEAYAACCGPLHADERRAATAQELMRARYSAFVVGDAGYLLRTWHPRSRPDALELEDTQLADTEWRGLDVLRSEAGGVEDDEGVIEFVARWARGGRQGRLHEVSRFRRRAGRWLYLDGDVGS